jgi:hypothetical protein
MGKAVNETWVWEYFCTEIEPSEGILSNGRIVEIGFEMLAQVKEIGVDSEIFELLLLLVR